MERFWFKQTIDSLHMEKTSVYLVNPKIKWSFPLDGWTCNRWDSYTSHRLQTINDAISWSGFAVQFKQTTRGGESAGRQSNPMRVFEFSPGTQCAWTTRTLAVISNDIKKSIELCVRTAMRRTHHFGPFAQNKQRPVGKRFNSSWRDNDWSPATPQKSNGAQWTVAYDTFWPSISC